MKKKLSLIALLALVFGLWAMQAPGAQASCGNGSARTVDDPTTEEDEDTPDEKGDPVGPSQSQAYAMQLENSEDGTPNGYAGVEGNTGYIEADGPSGNILEGSTSDGAVSGSLGTGGVCVNDTNVPG